MSRSIGDRADAKGGDGGGDGGDRPAKRQRTEKSSALAVAREVGQALVPPSVLDFKHLPLSVLGPVLVPFLVRDEMIVLAYASKHQLPLLHRLTELTLDRHMEHWLTHGRFGRDASPSPHPPIDLPSVFFGRLKRLQRLTLHGMHLPDTQVLVAISKLPELHTLRLIDMRLEEVTYLLRLPELLMALRAHAKKLRTLHLESMDDDMEISAAEEDSFGVLCALVQERQLTSLVLDCHLDYVRDTRQIVTSLLHSKLERFELKAVIANKETLNLIADTCPAMRILLLGTPDLEDEEGEPWTGKDVARLLERAPHLTSLVLLTRSNDENECFRVKMTREDKKSWDLQQLSEIGADPSVEQWAQMAGLLSIKAIPAWGLVHVSCPSWTAYQHAANNDWKTSVERLVLGIGDDWVWPTTSTTPLWFRTRFPDLQSLSIIPASSVGSVAWTRNDFLQVTHMRYRMEPWVQVFDAPRLLLRTALAQTDLLTALLQHHPNTRRELSIGTNTTWDMTADVQHYLSTLDLTPLWTGMTASLQLRTLILQRQPSNSRIPVDQLLAIGQHLRALEELAVGIEGVVLATHLLALRNLRILKLSARDILPGDEREAKLGSLVSHATLAQFAQHNPRLEQLVLELIESQMGVSYAAASAPWFSLPVVTDVHLLTAGYVNAWEVLATRDACPKLQRLVLLRSMHASPSPPAGTPKIDNAGQSTDFPRQIVAALTDTKRCTITVQLESAYSNPNAGHGGALHVVQPRPTGIAWWLLQRPPTSSSSSSTSMSLSSHASTGPRTSTAVHDVHTIQRTLTTAIASIHPSHRPSSADVDQAVAALPRMDEKRQDRLRENRRLAARLVDVLRGRKRSGKATMVHLVSSNPRSRLALATVNMTDGQVTFAGAHGGISLFHPTTAPLDISSAATLRRLTPASTAPPRLLPRLSTGSLLTFIPR
jgi:hypothetical protein